jgi:hypothetical protein
MLQSGAVLGNDAHGTIIEENLKFLKNVGPPFRTNKI